MDNATAEYTFVTTFFAPDPEPSQVPKELPMSPPTANAFLSPTVDDDDRPPMTPASDRGSFALQSSLSSMYSENRPPSISKVDQNALNAMWKQIMDPALEHSQVNILSQTHNETNRVL